MFQRFVFTLRSAWWLCGATLAAGLVPVLVILFHQGKSLAEQGTTSVSVIEALSYDLPFRAGRQALKDGVLIVQITTNQFEKLDRNRDSRVDREFMAEALRWIGERRPALVFVDCLFSDSTGSAGDQALATQLRELGEVLVLASSVTGPSEKPDSRFAQPGLTLGNVDVDSRPWNTVRLLPSRVSPTEEGRAASVLGAQKLGARPEPAPRGGRWLNYYGPSRGAAGQPDFPFILLDFAQIALPQPAPAPANPEVKRNTVVFVGDARHDWFRNPVDGADIPGVVIHATAVLNLFERSWLRLVPVELQVGFIGLWALALAFTLEARRTLATRIGVAAAALALGGISVLLHRWAGWWWWWLIPVGIQTPVALVVSAWSGGYVFFISYRDSDGRKDAEWLEGALRGVGRRPYLAPGLLTAGEAIWPDLARRIRRAPVFLLVMTPHVRADLTLPADVAPDGIASATPKPWVVREVEWALRQRRQILVLRAGTTPPRAEELRPEVRVLSERLSLEFSVERRDEALAAAIHLLHSGPTPRT